MKKKLSLSCRLSVLCATGILGAGAAHAQIVTNSRALDSLGGVAPPAQEAAPAPQERNTRTTHKATPHAVAKPRVQRPTPKATKPAPSSAATTKQVAPAPAPAP
ncbi:MAG: hypothetical protein ABF705_04065, partial [Acetobacter syzygii]